MPILDLDPPSPHGPDRRTGSRRAAARGASDSARDLRQPEFFSRQVSKARRFYLNMAPPPCCSLAVVSGGYETCDPDYSIHRGDFPYYAVEFVAGGEGKLTLGGSQHPLVPGSVFAYGPGVAQEIVNDPDHCLGKYFANFAGSTAQPLMAAAGLGPGQVVQVAAPDQILPLFEELIRTGLRDTSHRDRICVLLLEQILLRVAENVVPAGSAGTLAFETYQRCRAMIEGHYLELQALSEMAEVCRVDGAYLCRLFQRYDHQSPYQYLTRLRMGHAAQRLQSPGILIKQVADELGFSDPFHFSRSFGRVFGISPRRFVQLQRPREAAHPHDPADGGGEHLRQQVRS